MKYDEQLKHLKRTHAYLLMWLRGKSFADIARSEEVTYQTVAEQVHRHANRLAYFAANYEGKLIPDEFDSKGKKRKILQTVNPSLKDFNDLMVRLITDRGRAHGVAEWTLAVAEPKNFLFEIYEEDEDGTPGVAIAWWWVRALSERGAREVIKTAPSYSSTITVGNGTTFGLKEANGKATLGGG